jgi:hypothetical protein
MQIKSQLHIIKCTEFMSANGKCLFKPTEHSVITHGLGIGYMSSRCHSGCHCACYKPIKRIGLQLKNLEKCSKNL